MLSLSFPLGFGLLIVCAPTYRRRPKKHKPLPLMRPTVKGDLLADAKKLLANGHPTAAAMTARVEIERLLTVLAMTRPDFGLYWRGIHDTAHWLRAKHVIRKRTLDAIEAAVDVGNEAAHCKAVAGDQVCTMFGVIDSLRSSLDRKVGALQEGVVAA
jgi:hypothetical protein